MEEGSACEERPPLAFIETLFGDVSGALPDCDVRTVVPTLPPEEVRHAVGRITQRCRMPASRAERSRRAIASTIARSVPPAFIQHAGLPVQMEELEADIRADMLAALEAGARLATERMLPLIMRLETIARINKKQADLNDALTDEYRSFVSRQPT